MGSSVSRVRKPYRRICVCCYFEGKNGSHLIAMAETMTSSAREHPTASHASRKYNASMAKSTAMPHLTSLALGDMLKTPGD